jgi:hypothetical protein
VGPEAIQEMEEQMKKIRQRIKEAQDRHKSYIDAHHVDRSYEVGDQVFFDAGASLTHQASQRVEQGKDSWRAPAFKL